MSHKVEEGLLLLADRYNKQGYYMHSMHCLRALLGFQQLLPATEVKVRLELARLLLQHTYDVEQAKNELKVAHVLASTLPGSLCLRCEILSLMGSCHKQLGNEREQMDCMQHGITVCMQGTGHSNERHDLLQWQLYFMCRLAEVQLSQQNVAQALQWVGKALDFARQHSMSQQEVLLMLCRLHVQMHQPQLGPATQFVTELSSALVQMQSDPAASPTFLLQAKLNFNILQVLMQLREGRLQDLAVYTPEDKSKLLVFHQMDTLLQQLSQGRPAYQWLPYPALNATIHLLAANIMKPTGKAKLAMLHVIEGEKFVDRLLQDGGLQPLSTQSSTPAQVMFDASTPLLLKFLLLECRIQLQLLQTKFADARQDLWRAATLLSSYPFLQDQMTPALHLLLGMYAHSLGCFSEAALHCQAALRAGAGASKNANTVAACLKVLSSVEAHSPGAVSSGLDTLGPESDPDLGLVECVVVQFTRSVLRVEQGHLTEAKTLLGKALKLAHRRLSSHHLISTVLNLLAPLQLQDNDLAGGQQMGSSSYTLSRNNQDLPGLLNAFQVLHRTHELEAQDPASLAVEEDYLRKKSGELQRAVQEALADREQHQALMQWDLGREGARV